jgi:hypothetical protein
MFSYQIDADKVLVRILYGDNVIDESGPWDSLTSAIHWAEAYVQLKNSGLNEPGIN